MSTSQVDDQKSSPQHQTLHSLRNTGRCKKSRRDGKDCDLNGYPMTKYTKKWVCPRYMYDGKKYPNILSGSGYVMTRSVAKCLYKASLMLPYLHLEDVLVTGNKTL